MATPLVAPGFLLQDSPTVFVGAIPGHWLLSHSTPSWRIKDPDKGFQRVVREDRARQIAATVLDENRTFPNSVVLATDKDDVTAKDGKILLRQSSRLLVVDGQHRIWAQKFAQAPAVYSCVIHCGLSEVAMARLFLEINDNQKRVPSSLRWDLVRLVRPDDDPSAVAAAELVYELATDRSSPLYNRIDLTGELSGVDLKQGSLAPELKTLIGSKKPQMKDLGFEAAYDALRKYFTALRTVDSRGWTDGSSPLLKARVMRALIRLLADIAHSEETAPHLIPMNVLVSYVSRIKLADLADDNIKALQGSAGIKQIYSVLHTRLRL